MQRIKLLLIFSITAIVLYGCGQTGPLYFPKNYQPYHFFHKDH